MKAMKVDLQLLVLGKRKEALKSSMIMKSLKLGRNKKVSRLEDQKVGELI